MREAILSTYSYAKGFFLHPRRVQCELEEAQYGEDSDSLVGMRIVSRFELYGWCGGVIRRKNTNRQRKINGELVNFFAKFDMDEGESARRRRLPSRHRSRWRPTPPQAAAARGAWAGQWAGQSRGAAARRAP